MGVWGFVEDKQSSGNPLASIGWVLANQLQGFSRDFTTCVLELRNEMNKTALKKEMRSMWLVAERERTMGRTGRRLSNWRSLGNDWGTRLSTKQYFEAIALFEANLSIHWNPNKVKFPLKWFFCFVFLVLTCGSSCFSGTYFMTEPKRASHIFMVIST